MPRHVAGCLIVFCKTGETALGRYRMRRITWLKMSRLFESSEFLNRGWDIRLRESQSLRSVFVVLLLDWFMPGMLSSMMVYAIFRLHRFDWSTAILLPVFILPAIRYSRLIYRRLGR